MAERCPRSQTGHSMLAAGQNSAMAGPPPQFIGGRVKVLRYPDRYTTCLPQASRSWTSRAAGMMGISPLRSNASETCTMMANNRCAAPTTSPWWCRYPRSSTSQSPKGSAYTVWTPGAGWGSSSSGEPTLREKAFGPYTTRTPHADTLRRFQRVHKVSRRMCNWVCRASRNECRHGQTYPMPGAHILLASGKGAVVPRMPEVLTPRHRAKVGSPTNKTAFCDGMICSKGLAHRHLRGLHVETPQVAGCGFQQTVQVVHLDGVVGDTDLGRMEPLDPAHPGSCLRGLSLRHCVSRVQ